MRRRILPDFLIGAQSVAREREQRRHMNLSAADRVYAV
jgi:hypothetical protein